MGLAVASVIVVALILFSVLSPWPAVLLIRGLFDRGAASTVEEMERYAPTRGIDTASDVEYGPAPSDRLDWFSPSGGTAALPAVVWIHGGAWISGTKENVDPYVEILAAHGMTTVSLGCQVSPEATYPRALEQLNSALAFLTKNAERFRIDPDRIVLAGDSAGAQLASQLAALVTNPDYARTLEITPGLRADQLRGVVLNCGIFDVSGIPDAPGIGGWGFRTALWAYLGEKDWSRTAGGREMSTIDYVTDDFPATWISGGNGDPLTASQSKALAKKLVGVGVAVTPVFYPEDHDPTLPHEYQFHLDYVDARAALESTISFVTTETRP